MTPIELFQEARLTEALAEQRRIVEARPDDPGERLLLCDLLAFAGERAAVRPLLKSLKEGPPEIREYVVEWLDLLDADDARHASAMPEFLIEPPQHLRTRLRAVIELSAGRDEPALDMLDDADEMAPWIEGHVDGRAFGGWRDTDDVLGPVLELFERGRYVWLAMDQIHKLRLEEPSGLRDNLYRPATIWLADGTEREVFIPVLYAGTAEHAEEGIRTGAGIDWIERDGLMRGLGSRTFLFGEEELALDEFRQVEIR
jgi:protein involved in temperature-dependent protein secretion